MFCDIDDRNAHISKSACFYQSETHDVTVVTIYEIAEKAGVSPKTAARILSGETRRSKKQEEVKEWARRLGYVRNANAANLRTGRSSLAGIIVPYIDNPYYTQVIQELHDALDDQNLKALVSCSFGKSDEILAALNVFRSYDVDGIFLNLSQGKLTPEVVDLLKQFQKDGKPVVLMGCSGKEMAFDVVDIDNASGIAKAVGYLAAKGHERIAFMGGNAGNETLEARHRGYLKGMEEAGLEVDEAMVSVGEPTSLDAARRTLELLESEPVPTAIVCAADVMAPGVIKSCAAKGLRLPDDLALTGFDDVSLASLMIPSLTTLRQPIAQIAKDAVNQFVSRIESGDFSKPRFIVYETELIIRESA